MNAQLPAVGSTAWILTECHQDDSTVRTHLVSGADYLVGRSPPAMIVIASPAVSTRHAVLASKPQGLYVRDLGSTNGTFVNGARIIEHTCAEGDLVQFAKEIFRVSRREESKSDRTIEAGALSQAEALIQFDLLMNGRGLKPVFQPIVDLKDESIVAYELLARSEHSHLSNPAAMFGFAALLGQESHLSELMRSEGAHLVDLSRNRPNLFVNTHPKEIINTRFLDSLATLRRKHADMIITVEIHEAAVTNASEMRELREFLHQHSMLLAYDDFGAGQARLDELSEVPPDYLKFDIKLIRDLDKAAGGRKSMVQFLVRMSKDLGIGPLAEGVETAGEARVCAELGFELAQGYHFGRPAPLPSK